jgi:hypothetical protein
MKITRSKGGTAEREVDVQDIQVPDLWHVAMHLKELSESSNSHLKHKYKIASEEILETWHLAHDMKRYLQEQAQ